MTRTILFGIAIVAVLGLAGQPEPARAESMSLNYSKIDWGKKGADKARRPRSHSGRRLRASKGRRGQKSAWPSKIDLGTLKAGRSRYPLKLENPQ